MKGHKDAIDYFNEAIDIDPNFALAYVGLADSYSSLSLISRLDFKNHFIKTKDAALSALKIDSNLAEAHTSLGFVKLWYEWDWTGAANDFKRAIQLNPNYAEAHHNYADCLVTFRQFDEAIDEAKQALELDPITPQINKDYAACLYFAHKYDQAIEECLKALDKYPDFAQSYQILALSYLYKGMFSEAILGMQKCVKYAEHSTFHLALLGYVYGYTGNQVEAETILNGLIETSKEERVDPLAFARIYVGLGDNDNAIRYLEKAYEEHSHGLAWIHIQPCYVHLHSDPRFIALIGENGLSQF